MIKTDKSFLSTQCEAIIYMSQIRFNTKKCKSINAKNMRMDLYHNNILNKQYRNSL